MVGRFGKKKTVDLVKKNYRKLEDNSHPIEKYKNGNGKVIHLGLFVIEEDARDAYIKRAREYNEKFGCMYSS